MSNMQDSLSQGLSDIDGDEVGENLLVPETQESEKV